MDLFIHAILSATLFTLGVTIVNVVTNNKNKLIYYFFIYIGMFFTSLLTPILGDFLFPKANASEIQEKLFYECEENEFLLDAKSEISMLKEIFRKLTPEQQKNYKNKAQFHLKESDRCYKEAYYMCWYIPNRDDRENAYDCFKYAVGALMPGTPLCKAAGVVLVAAGDYGLNCLKEWNKMQTLLKEAQYHFEMYEFYVTVQVRG